MKNQKIKNLIIKAKASAEAQNIQKEKLAILEILKYLPGDKLFIERLGDIEHALGNFKEAERLFELILKDYKTPQLLYKLAVIKTLLRKLREAVNIYSEVINLKKNFFQAHYNLGMVLLDLDCYEEAILRFKTFLEHYPDYVDAYLNLGVAYQALKKFDEALFYYKNAILKKPDFAEAYNNQGNVYSELENNKKALLNYKKAIKVSLNYSEPYNGIAVLYHEMNDMKKAVNFYNKAISFNQDYIEAYNNLGICYYETKKHSLALNCFDRIINIQPYFPDALFNKALVKLSLGQFGEGFRLYEQRRESKTLNKMFPAFKEPLWLGEESLRNKRIYIYSEQGFGDIIQFSRYVNLLIQEKCNHIYFGVPQELKSLMKNSFKDKVDVISHLPENLNFDFQCPLMSLPLAFKTEVKDIPSSIPYLHPKRNLVEHWGQKLGIKNRKRVGIAWSGGFRGNDPLTRLIFRRKSIPLDTLKTLFNVDLDFFSLQKGKQAELELKSKKVSLEKFDMIDYSSEFISFHETAALIENLDLVITVCTSIAHLSGALGKSTWVLIPYENCWRWFDDGREDSPWYPSIKLFRQSQSGDWISVVDKVYSELNKFAKL